MKRRMKTYLDAKPCKIQHKKPCCDCPFSRESFPGWLAGFSPEKYVQLAHGDGKIDCHTKVGPQCAGAAIYRANVMKRPRDRICLELATDREGVFASPVEFIEHHGKGQSE